MTIRNVYHTAHADVKVWTDDICENTVEQLRNTAGLPIIHGHVAAMPDTHLGKQFPDLFKHDKVRTGRIKFKNRGW